MAELSDYTSLRVGGPAKKFIEVSSEKEIIEAIEGAADSPILIMGAGTNMLVSDDGFAGTVIRISNNKIEAEVDACSGATLTIGAGENWDEFVKTTISRGFAGLETLSGIPGTVGAAPIQNIGAYGHEVSEFITRVRTYDRQVKALKLLQTKSANFLIATHISRRTLADMLCLTLLFNYELVKLQRQLLTPNWLVLLEYQWVKRVQLLRAAKRF